MFETSRRLSTDVLPSSLFVHFDHWSYLLQDIKFNVHAHPTLSEVLDELFKQAHVDAKVMVSAKA